jgi:hypothetical protein
MDITTLTSQGITPFRAEWVEYKTNPRNPFKYRIQFIKHSFDSDKRRMNAVFWVERYITLNNEWVFDISWFHDAIVINDTKVDKDGNIITELTVTIPSKKEGEEDQIIPNPLVWGGEFERMAVLFSAPIPDSDIV